MNSGLRKPLYIPSDAEAENGGFDEGSENAAQPKAEAPEDTILYEALASAIRSICEVPEVQGFEALLCRVLRILPAGRGLYCPFAGVDMAETDLRCLNLRHADLARVNLKSAHLEYANLCFAHLKDAFLRGAHLKDAFLRGAHLERANLYFAHLKDARLWDANLKGADLEGADLEGANLKGADLGDAHLAGANLRGAHLQGAYLKDAYLQGANLRGVDFSEETILPDGSKWKPGTDLTKFRKPKAEGEEKAE